MPIERRAVTDKIVLYISPSVVATATNCDKSVTELVTEAEDWIPK